MKNTIYKDKELEILMDTLKQSIITQTHGLLEELDNSKLLSLLVIPFVRKDLSDGFYMKYFHAPQIHVMSQLIKLKLINNFDEANEIYLDILIQIIKANKDINENLGKRYKLDILKFLEEYNYG